MLIAEDVVVSFNPTIENLADIEEWMVKENGRPVQHQGNWIAIQSAYTENRLVTASYGNKTTGFFVLLESYPIVTIVVAETHPSFRSKGIGRKLLETVANKLKKQNFYAVDLKCAPISSEPIWKKLGFTNIPQSESRLPESMKLFLPIKEHLMPAAMLANSETLEIWNDEPFMTKDVPAKWSYNLQFHKSTRILLLPILLYADYEWRVRWKDGDKELRDCKLKYFSKEIEIANCLFIERLPQF